MGVWAMQISKGSHSEGVKLMKKLFCRFGNDDSGATAIEYGLLAALIAVVMITAVTTLGSNLSAVFSNIASNIVK